MWAEELPDSIRNYEKLNVEAGDIISLYNGSVAKAKSSVAKEVPSFAEERERINQIDGIIRENAFVSLGENRNKKIKAEIAKTYYFVPFDSIGFNKRRR